MAFAVVIVVGAAGCAVKDKAEGVVNKRYREQISMNVLAAVAAGFFNQEDGLNWNNPVARVIIILVVIGCAIAFVASIVKGDWLD